jgi:hypothetical protein
VAFETGALGYVRKAAAGEELVNAGGSALRGERHTGEGPSEEQ